MALNSRLPARNRTGPQRPRSNADENSLNIVQAALNKHVRQPSVVGPVRVPIKTGPQRPILSEVTTSAANKQGVKTFGKNASLKEDVAALKRGRSSSVSTVPSGPQRVPLGVKNSNLTTSSTAQNLRASVAPLRPQRPSSIQRSETAPDLGKIAPVSVPEEIEDDESMEIEQEEEIVEGEVEVVAEPNLQETGEDELDDEVEQEDSSEPTVTVTQIWPELTPRAAQKYKKEIERIQASFKDDVDEENTTMVHEYADEIFDYMGRLETEVMPSPNYMDGQNEVDYSMRETLVDWLLQVHLRYHLLPETLWIAINIVDRFLSQRVVSVVKLQLVGVTAMFIAAKYEEILAPSVDEFVYMTENGYTREEVLKGEKIMLQTLDFKVSSYCSPYSWMRKISKADDYDIQTRTLCKFLVEVTLLDHHFLRVKPSLVAAIGMYTSRRMLGGDWGDAFVFYSGYTEEYLQHGHRLIVKKMQDKGFEDQYVCRKYANKKFLKASVYAVAWARQQGTLDDQGDVGDAMLMAD